MFKRGLLTLLVLLLVICVCVGSLFATGWVVATKQPASYLLAGPTPGATAAARSSLPPVQTSPEISVEVSQQMDQIQNQVMVMRGLTLLHGFKRVGLTSDQLAQKVKIDFLKNYTPQQAADEGTLYNTLGLLEPDTDLIALYENVYNEQQNFSYYDTQSETIYVARDSVFNGMQRMAYAREFTRLLLDQYYDLQGTLKITGAACRADPETCSAAKALVNGDVLSVEQDWLYSSGTSEDRAQVQDFTLHDRRPVFNSSPEFIKSDLLFPSQRGYEFVQSLQDQGGWQAVDQAYDDLPTSTAQILHPNLYPNHVPATKTLPDLRPVLGSQWRLSLQGSLGEWRTYLALTRGWQRNTFLPEVVGQQAAAGWSGDSYALYQEVDNPKIRVLVVEWEWSSLTDSNQFWNALATQCKGRWGNPVQESGIGMKWSAKDGETASIQSTNLGTRWIIASNQTLFERVRAAFK